MAGKRAGAESVGGEGREARCKQTRGVAKSGERGRSDLDSVTGRRDMGKDVRFNSGRRSRVARIRPDSDCCSQASLSSPPRQLPPSSLRRSSPSRREIKLPLSSPPCAPSTVPPSSRLLTRHHTWLPRSTTNPSLPSALAFRTTSFSPSSSRSLQSTSSALLVTYRLSFAYAGTSTMSSEPTAKHSMREFTVASSTLAPPFAGLGRTQSTTLHSLSNS